MNYKKTGIEIRKRQHKLNTFDSTTGIRDISEESGTKLQYESVWEEIVKQFTK